MKQSIAFFLIAYAIAFYIIKEGVAMFYILHKRKLLPIDPDRVYAFCPSCGVLHAVDLQSIIEAEGEDFDLLKTIDYCAECSQVRKEEQHGKEIHFKED